MCDFIHEDGGWDVEGLKEYFGADVGRMILSLPLADVIDEDGFGWAKSAVDKVVVADVYKDLVANCERAQGHVARVGVEAYGGPESESLPLEGPCRVFLANRGMNVDTLCPGGTGGSTAYLL